MPCRWELSYTPKNNGKISRYALLVSSERSRPKRVRIRFLWLASLSWSGRTDVLEKYTAKPTAVNLCSRYASSAHLLWKPSPCFQRALQNKRKLCFSAGRWLLSFLPDESVWFRCRAATEVSAGSPWPPSMWLIHLANLCHRFIVFRWSVHWQMTCDQFYHSAPRLSWEIGWYHSIQWKNERTCFRQILISVLTKVNHILISVSPTSHSIFQIHLITWTKALNQWQM